MHDILKFKYMGKRGDVGLYGVTLELGCYYEIDGVIARFIKVTPKGFNFLHEDTNRCVLRHHVYARGYAGKDIKDHETSFFVVVTNMHRLRPALTQGAG